MHLGVYVSRSGCEVPDLASAAEMSFALARSGNSLGPPFLDAFVELDRILGLHYYLDNPDF
jgi:hypothetical protein